MRVTPDGLQFAPAGEVVPQSPEWHLARARGIGSSDIPKILGLSRYGTAAHVWLEKTGRTGPEDAGEAAEWGTLFEDTIAKKWARDYSGGRFRVARIGMVRNAFTPWMLASPDRRVYGCTPTAHGCGLEVKMRSAFKAGEWSTTIPDDVMAQVQWQLAVTGWPHVHVAALVGQHLVTEDVYPDQAVQAYIFEKAAAVWQAILDDVEPELPTGDLLVDYLDRLHADRETDAVIELDDVKLADAAVALSTYRRARATAKQAKIEMGIAKGELVKVLGPAEVAVHDGEILFTRKLAGARRSTNYKLLQASHPEVYAEVVTTGEPARRLSVPGEEDDD